MAAIVDVYDALTSDRPYRKGWEPTRVLGKMLEWSRDHFGEAMTHQFVRCVGIYPVGTLVRLSSAEIAVVVEQDEEYLLRPRIRLLFNEKSGRHITPRDMELSASSIEIIEAASAQKVGIDPLVFL